MSLRLINTSLLSVILVACYFVPNALADPCGMVPPIYTGEGQPIVRAGDQRTYVFYKDGIETFVIRPGYEGKVDEFGMLIPFPSVPAIRKVPDHIFPHLTAAIDPPEVVVDLRPKLLMQRASSSVRRKGANKNRGQGLAFRDEVRVVKQEAIGMYEVAVLEAGSAAALKKWMTNHGYKYPDGMDAVCEEYVDDAWCFVAVKSKVGQKAGVDPEPGQRQVNAKLPQGSTFDGHVQGMGFRFASEELVVPMRLSAFNAGELRNQVYILTDKPQKIRSIPEEYVVRQISGEALHRNVTGPLPLRILGGTEADLTDAHRKSLIKQREPEQKNGAAKQLFASDLKAIASDDLSLPHEEKEKELLAIGEALGLRGGEIDKLHTDAVEEISRSAVADSLVGLKEMAMTVVDGDFPRDVLARKNLKFAQYNMPARRNKPQVYDTKTKQPAKSRQGVLILGALPTSVEEQQPRLEKNKMNESRSQEMLATRRGLLPWTLSAAGLMLLGIALLPWHRIGRTALVGLCACGILTLAVAGSFAADEEKDDSTRTIRQLLNDLSHKEKAEAAVEALVARGDQAKAQLKGEASEGNDLTRRGWAIIALSEIGGDDVDTLFEKIHTDDKQPMLVRTWAAAGRVTLVDTADELTALAPLVQQFPATGRPIGMRLVEKLNDGGEASAEGLLSVSMKVPQLQQSLATAILALGPDKLTEVMSGAKDQNVRRQAAAYLATMAGQNKKDEVAKAVVKTYAFDPMAEQVPWEGGPLFVPGIQWDKENAQALAGDLIKWHLWCDRHSKKDQQQQIHNNIRSLSLANAAGYQSPGFQEANTLQWLQVWGKAMGKESVQAMLEEQSVEDDAKYTKALEGL